MTKAEKARIRAREWYYANRQKALEARHDYYSKNKRKVKEYKQRYGIRNKDKRRAQFLKQTYGISVQEWENLLAAQGNVCAICKTKEPGKRGWHTDHNHETGVVRGILCSNCNTGLGLFQDNTSTLASAIVYLENSRG